MRLRPKQAQLTLKSTRLSNMTTDRVKIQDELDDALKKELKAIDWRRYLHYGTVTVLIRNDSFEGYKVERTIQD